MSIKEFQEVIAEAKRVYPYMRIGQIIANSSNIVTGYITDEELIKAIKEYIKRAKEGV